MWFWYPQSKHELSREVKKFLTTGKRKKEIKGIIVPHAGFEYSGAIAGKAFSLVKPLIKKAIIIGPSHYIYLDDVMTSNKSYWETPLGKIKLFNKDFLKGDIEQEHSLKNQVPFLQKLGCSEILPLMVGKISEDQAKEIAKKLLGIKTLFVFSTDLSHFLEYEQAVSRDKNTIDAIENLDLMNFSSEDACGYYPLLIMQELCKIKKIKPQLIEYKNSGDVTGDREGVVGYASFYF